MNEKTFRGLPIPNELASLAVMSMDAERQGLDTASGKAIIEIIGRQTIRTWQTLAEKWISRG